MGFQSEALFNCGVKILKNIEMRRVAVTGLGAISALGHDVQTIWENALAGKSGVSKIEQIENIDELPVRIGGEVKNFQVSEDLISVKEQPRFDRFIHFAIHAADEAIKQSGFDYPPERVGCILGVGMGGFPIIESSHKVLLERGPRRVSPFFIPAIIPNMATGLISIHYGFKGINYTIASACASSAHALQAAVQDIMLGRHDVVISGGAEAVVTPLTISAFASMRALSKRNDEPERASRPFDKDRNGFVIGEGAGVLVLEDYEKAQSRGANILAEIVGFGASADANHISAPHPEGEGAILALRQCLDTAGLRPEKIDYINAHGTSTPLGDVAETKALKAVFGDHAYKLNVSSTKSMTGHLLGAAGGLESIFCVKAITDQCIPPTINLENPAEECDLNYTANQQQKREVNYALNNSFGFGGTNSTLIFKKPE
jgi:3-oxoacyl-[acyl-carrier-protein] synthase II